jgi:hypothetical protein
VQVVAANARAQHSGRAIKLFDLLPETRPELVTFDVAMVEVVDACSRDGITALGFSENFPYGVAWPPVRRSLTKRMPRPSPASRPDPAPK